MGVLLEVIRYLLWRRKCWRNCFKKLGLNQLQL